jgi:DNA-binding NarL/FixJ family response regulator
MHGRASGYLTKQAAADELVMAIRAVAAGNVYLQPALARWLLEDYHRLARRAAVEEVSAVVPTAGPPGLDILSARERQVLEMVAEGLSNPSIAARLTLSPKTIARHRERIMRKLNLHSRERVKYAIRTARHTGLAPPRQSWWGRERRAGIIRNCAERCGSLETVASRNLRVTTAGLISLAGRQAPDC